MLLTIIAFIVILGLLIFVHELGHFLSAKKSGVKVEEFGFGFPPRLWSKQGKDGVVYSLNWIPIGGFVKIKGEGGEHREDKDSFSHQSFWIKGMILSAGVLMNILLAYLLFSVGYMFGLPVALADETKISTQVRDVKVQIASVIKDSPAAQAGLAVADQILKVDNLEISKVKELQDYLKAHQDQPVMLTFKNQNKIKEVPLSQQRLEGFSEGKVIGVTLIRTGIISYDFFTSWYQGAVATVDLLIQIIFAFYELIKNLIMGLGLTIELSGPVGVAVMTGRVVNLGMNYLLQFVALLSLNLAVVNFLPFPALDGGRFLFLIIEKIRRRPNNQKIENLIHNLGFSLLMTLVIVVTYRDILRYGSGLIEKLKDLF